jgi:ElaB/YqjD/DUF883 family membrane-anchored ribosome-binding protein
MNADDTRNTTQSAGTSRITPPSGRASESHPASEQEFLKDEMENARAAIVQTLEHLKTDLKTAADVRLWAREHPWATVGAAAAVGFLAAAALIPEAEPKKRPEELERPRHREHVPDQKPLASSGWLSSMLVPLVDLARSWTERFLQTAFHSGQDFASGNGHAESHG